MAEKMIKVLLFTYGKEVDNPWYVEGEPETLLQEQTARLGEVHDITRPYDLRRGEENDAFFSDEERKAIEGGTYRGVDAPAVVQARLATAQNAGIQPVEGEGAGGEELPDISSMSDEEVANLISERKLNVNQTVDLADENDVDSVNKVLDAENIATENDPRAGVTKSLEAKLARAAQNNPDNDA